MKKLFYLLLGISVTLASCQRVISVAIDDAGQQLVIEANMTDQRGTQTVKLSNSIPYSNTNVFPTVSGALVTMTNSFGTVFKFTETQPGTYTLSNFKGTVSDVYDCTVKVGGKTYDAFSGLPTLVPLDSIGVIGQVFGSKTLKTITAFYNDPAAAANQYRFVMTVNGVQVKRVFVDDDRLTNGRSVTTSLFERDIELKTGDKVDIEMQCIDPFVYNYWFALASQGGNSPANSATPSNPPSNFNNGALGYFSAHTVQRKSIIVP